MRVDDVSCAVSLSGTTTASSSTVAGPAWWRSTCCPCQRMPSFQWRTFRTQNVCRPLECETNKSCGARICCLVRGCASVCNVEKLVVVSQIV